MVFYNSDIELQARFPVYRAANSGREMSAYKVLREMQEKPWTMNTGADALPAPNADLKRFYEQGVIEFITGARSLSREAWTVWLAEFDKLGGAQWEEQGIKFARENGYIQ